MRVLSGEVKFLFCAGMVALWFLRAEALPAAIPATDPNARALAAAENSFAHESVTKGMRTAFLHVLSADAIAFEPGPTNARQAWAAKKESAGVLAWQPVLAVVAASGDFGYTTGPWSFKNKKEDQEPAAYGEFVSIWRREAGTWKLLFDLGSDHPAPTGPVADLVMIDQQAPNESEEIARADLLERDRAYAAAPAKEFAAVAADDIRLYRPDKFPILGKAAGEKEKCPALTFAAPQGEIARSGDLGFAWGEYRGAASGYYLRIWRKNTAGAWQLGLELLHPR